MLSYLRSLIQLILAPRYGWEDVETDEQSAEAMFSHGFLPLAAIGGATTLLQMVYHSGHSFVSTLIAGVIEFMSYFLGYYIALLILGSTLPAISAGVYDRQCLKIFVMHNMGLMCLVGILRNCLPSDFSTVYFLLIYLAIIMWRGMDFMSIRPGNSLKFTVECIIAIIVPALLIQLALGAIVI